jgi:hypothetical protein
MTVRYTIRREAKISTAQYENTSVSVEISEDATSGITEEDQLAALIRRADGALRKKIDEIELGNIRSKSKASRFGV